MIIEQIEVKNLESWAKKIKSGISYNIESIRHTFEGICCTGWVTNCDELKFNINGSFKAIKIEFSARPDVAQHSGLAEKNVLGFKAIIPRPINKLELKFFKSGLEELSVLLIDGGDSAIQDTREHATSITTKPNIKDSILIVGGAPTIKDYESKFKSFEGEIWALNDAWFWLEKKGIVVDKVVVTDSRFFMKVKDKLDASSCRYLITLDSIDTTLISHLNFEILELRNLGLDGFSLKFGEVFHNCSVFYTALQTAISLGCKNISCCGVLLGSPLSYMRIDGSVSMPEYAYTVQLRNLKVAIETIKMLGINCEVYESESMLNYF